MARLTIKNALETIKLRKEDHTLQARYLQENLPCFIGESRAILDVMDFIDDVAKSPDTPVLLIGETGTGKELIASSIHYRSPNFQGPLAIVNCAAIPTDLIESELLGNERSEDLIPLVKHFLFEFNTKFNKNLSGLLSEAEKLLLVHNWTGNVRELKDLIERGVLIGKGTELTPHDLGVDHKASANASPSTGRTAIFPPIPETGIDLNEIERSMERYYIETAYKMAKGN